MRPCCKLVKWPMRRLAHPMLSHCAVTIPHAHTDAARARGMRCHAQRRSALFLRVNMCPRRMITRARWLRAAITSYTAARPTHEHRRGRASHIPWEHAPCGVCAYRRDAPRRIVERWSRCMSALAHSYGARRVDARRTPRTRRHTSIGIMRCLAIRDACLYAIRVSRLRPEPRVCRSTRAYHRGGGVPRCASDRGHVRDKNTTASRRRHSQRVDWAAWARLRRAHVARVGMRGVVTEQFTRAASRAASHAAPARCAPHAVVWAHSVGRAHRRARGESNIARGARAQPPRSFVTPRAHEYVASPHEAATHRAAIATWRA